MIKTVKRRIYFINNNNIKTLLYKENNMKQIINFILILFKNNYCNRLSVLKDGLRIDPCETINARNQGFLKKSLRHGSRRANESYNKYNIKKRMTCVRGTLL